MRWVVVGMWVWKGRSQERRRLPESQPRGVQGRAWGSPRPAQPCGGGTAALGPCGALPAGGMGAATLRANQLGVSSRFICIPPALSQ